jgi:hypothetical protein
MNRFLSWLGSKLSPQEAISEPVEPQTAPPRVTPRPPPPPEPEAPEPELVEFDSAVRGRVADGGTGKNILMRSKHVREETGTHDTLMIITDSATEDEDEFGSDPYNSGRFDRSQSWNLRTRK